MTCVVGPEGLNLPKLLNNKVRLTPPDQVTQFCGAPVRMANHLGGHNRPRRDGYRDRSLTTNAKGPRHG